MTETDDARFADGDQHETNVQKEKRLREMRDDVYVMAGNSGDVFIKQGESVLLLNAEEAEYIHEQLGEVLD